MEAAPLRQLRLAAGRARKLIGEQHLAAIRGVPQNDRAAFARKIAVMKRCLLATPSSVPDQRGDIAWHGHILTVTFRFSPRFGFSPVSRAFANSYAATALLAGPSQSSATSGSTRSTQTFGSLGPFHHMLSVDFQIALALPGSRCTTARAV